MPPRPLPLPDAPPPACYQQGVFTVRQALEAGWSRATVKHRRAKGHWVVVAGRGLTLRPLVADPFPPGMLAHAARLTWGHGVVCGRVAAAMHGLPVDPALDVEMLTGPGQRPLTRLRPRTPPCGPDDVDLMDGVRVTTVLRTAVDCLARFPPGEALDLLAWLVTREVLHVGDLQDAIRERQGKPGVTQLIRLRDRLAAGALSAAEDLMHELLRVHRIAHWEANARVDLEGTIAVVDVLFRRQRIAIEVDGRRAHDTPDRFVADRRRQNALVAAGFVVLRFTWQDLTQRPDAVIAQIRTALSRTT